MKLLLDTHILLWLSRNDPQLAPAVLESVLDEGNEVLVSEVSLFEIVNKLRIGKLPGIDVDKLTRALSEYGFSRLGMTDRHLSAMARIRTVEGHNDPFDIMLVAQARADSLVLVTADRKIIAHYDVEILVADRSPTP